MSISHKNDNLVIPSIVNEKFLHPSDGASIVTIFLCRQIHVYAILKKAIQYNIPISEENKLVVAEYIDSLDVNTDHEQFFIESLSYNQKNYRSRVYSNIREMLMSLNEVGLSNFAHHIPTEYRHLILLELLKEHVFISYIENASYKIRYLLLSDINLTSRTSKDIISKLLITPIESNVKNAIYIILVIITLVSSLFAAIVYNYASWTVVAVALTSLLASLKGSN